MREGEIYRRGRAHADPDAVPPRAPRKGETEARRGHAPATKPAGCQTWRCPGSFSGSPVRRLGLGREPRREGVGRVQRSRTPPPLSPRPFLVPSPSLSSDLTPECRNGVPLLGVLGDCWPKRHRELKKTCREAERRRSGAASLFPLWQPFIGSYVQKVQGRRLGPAGRGGCSHQWAVWSDVPA